MIVYHLVKQVLQAMNYHWSNIVSNKWNLVNHIHKMNFWMYYRFLIASVLIIYKHSPTDWIKWWSINMSCLYNISWKNSTKLTDLSTLYVHLIYQSLCSYNISFENNAHYSFKASYHHLCLRFVSGSQIISALLAIIFSRNVSSL